MCYGFVICLETNKQTNLILDCTFIPSFLHEKGDRIGRLSQTRQMGSFLRKGLGREGEICERKEGWT